MMREQEIQYMKKGIVQEKADTGNVWGGFSELSLFYYANVNRKQ